MASTAGTDLSRLSKDHLALILLPSSNDSRTSQRKKNLRTCPPPPPPEKKVSPAKKTTRRPAVILPSSYNVVHEVNSCWKRIRQTELQDIAAWTRAILKTPRIEQFGHLRVELDIVIKGKVERRSVRRSARHAGLLTAV
jgi:hypothetical protein